LEILCKSYFRKYVSRKIFECIPKGLCYYLRTGTADETYGNKNKLHLCVCNVFVFQGPCHVTLDIFFFNSNIAPTAGQRGTEHMGGIKTGDL